MILIIVIENNSPKKWWGEIEVKIKFTGISDKQLFIEMNEFNSEDWLRIFLIEK